MDGFLLRGQSAEPFEDGVHMLDSSVEIEDRVDEGAGDEGGGAA